MKGEHLTPEQWAALLAGEGNAEVSSHVSSCASCRQELTAWREGLAELGRWEPDPWSRTRIREAALDRAFGARRRVWWWAMLPATAGVLAALTLWPSRPAPVAEAELDAVLSQVEATLARDPLATFAGPEVLEVVLGELEGENAGNAS